MSYMFLWCDSLKELNLYNFNTNKVTSMSWMFLNCSREFKMKIRAKYDNLIKLAFIKNYSSDCSKLIIAPLPIFPTTKL